jgi:hypothetical protein
MAGSHSSCERDVNDGHIWDTCPDYIPNVNRMFLLGKCWTKCLNACNVLSMFPLKSRYPRPQCKEMDRVVELVGQKVDAKMGEFSSDLMEALEIEENRRKDLEAKVAFLEEKLVNSLTHTADLVALVLSVQSCVVELEDAVMEESEEGDGGEVVSSSSSDLDPVENLVAIPVPAPSFVHTLVEIPEEFVPLILRPPLSIPSTPSPEYVQALEDDPAHDGIPEYWADPEAGVDH